MVWAALLFAAVARKRRLAKVFVAVSSLVSYHSRWAGVFCDAVTVFEEEAARTTIAFNKRVLVRWAKRGVRTFLFRAVSMAPVAVLFNVSADFRSVAAGTLCASLVELRSFASQPILALPVYQKRFRIASLAHLLSSKSDPRRSASRQGWLAARNLAQATFDDASTPARSLSYRKEACGSAA